MKQIIEIETNDPHVRVINKDPDTELHIWVREHGAACGMHLVYHYGSSIQTGAKLVKQG